MVFFNYALRKLNAKIVFYGPGLCGKTTNLQWIHDNFEGGDKGKMVSLATEGDRTIFFDLLPLDIGKIRGMDVTLQLYTVPGQVHYNSTRQLVLRGADGVVFVADSQRAMQTSNTDSLKNLDENLGLQGINLDEFPHVLQFNKRDLGELMAMEEMDAALNRFDAPIFDAVAVEGIGVQETLEGIVRLVMRSLKNRYEARGLGAQSPGIKRAGADGPLPVPVGDSPQRPPSIRPLSAAEVPTIPSAHTSEDLSPLEAPGTVAFESQQEPAPFEEIDTQTGLLVPPVDAPESDAAGFEPADHLPSGPGKPFGAIDENVSVAQYDTADVEELRESVPSNGEAHPEETVVEWDGVAGDDGVESAETDSYAGVEWGLPTDQAEDVGSRPLPTDEVDDLLASVLSPMEMDGKAFDEPVEPEVDVPEAGDQPEEISVETAPDEIGPEEQAPEEDVFDMKSDQTLETDQEPFPTYEDAGGEGESVFPGEVDEMLERPVAAEDFEGDFREPAERPSTMVPVVFDDGDPFSVDEWEQTVAQPPISAVVEVVDADQQAPVSVSVEDNSLALKLTGTGAIIESGQVRALDIEVPVPGNWVGNRRVTLQLRLTLLPVTEDENDGTNGPA